MNAQYNKAGGHWPFCSAELAETTGKERMQNLLGSEVLFVPRIFLGDQLTDDPVAWLKRVMAQYVQTEE